MSPTYLPRRDASLARGTVVVVDVLRAFTTAAYAFQRDASAIRLVSTVETALALHTAHPDCLLIGELEGYAINGFDLCNSPFEVSTLALDGRCLIQRTTSGTVSALDATQASELLCASFVNAHATASALCDSSDVTYIVSGWDADGPTEDGDEDFAAAEYIEQRRGEPRGCDPTPYIARVVNSPSGRKLAREDGTRGRYPQDLHLAIEVDSIDVVMRGTNHGDHVLLQAS